MADHLPASNDPAKMLRAYIRGNVQFIGSHRRHLKALTGGGTRLLLAKEGWVTAISGVWFLASARSSRPLALVFTQPFLRGHWGLIADWDTVWEREPRPTRSCAW